VPDDDQNLENSGPAEYLGLIPAAGLGSRLPANNNAKEMLAVGIDGRPVIGHLLDIMCCAGIHDVAVVLRPQKTDLASYLKSRLWEHMHLDLRFTPGTSGVPETVALGLENLGLENPGLEKLDFEDIHHRPIAFGFPDILFEPNHALSTIMEKLDTGDSQAVLGLFPTDSPEKSDMVGIDKHGNVAEIEIKPSRTQLDLTWILAVWKPSFSRYLLRKMRTDPAPANEPEVMPNAAHLGQVFQAAINEGMQIGTVSFEQGSSLDIGTPDDLALAQAWRA